MVEIRIYHKNACEWLEHTLAGRSIRNPGWTDGKIRWLRRIADNGFRLKNISPQANNPAWIIEFLGRSGGRPDEAGSLVSSAVNKAEQVYTAGWWSNVSKIAICRIALARYQEKEISPVTVESFRNILNSLRPVQRGAEAAGIGEAVYKGIKAIAFGLVPEYGGIGLKELQKMEQAVIDSLIGVSEDEIRGFFWNLNTQIGALEAVFEGLGQREDIVLRIDRINPPLTLKLLTLYPRIRAFVVNEKETGSSHSGDIAASRGAGIYSNPEVVCEAGQQCIFDSLDKKLILNPSGRTLEDYRDKVEIFKREELNADVRKRSKTLDGKTFKLLLAENFVDAGGIRDSIKNLGLSGVGLLRTDYMFNYSIPSEEEQYRLYLEIADNVKGEVVIRTLDKQPDKAAWGIFKDEETGLRFSLGTREGMEIFRSQVRAIMRANADSRRKNICLSLPMVSTKEEIRRIRDFLDGLGGEIPVKICAMIETPEAVRNIDYIVEHFDSISIGTNDLTKHTFNINRDKDEHYYATPQYRIFSDIKKVVHAARKRKKTVIICGDLPKEKFFLPFYLYLLVPKEEGNSLKDDVLLSVTSADVRRIKDGARSLSYQDCVNRFKWMFVEEDGFPLYQNIKTVGPRFLRRSNKEKGGIESQKELAQAIGEIGVRLNKHLCGNGNEFNLFSANGMIAWCFRHIWNSFSWWKAGIACAEGPRKNFFGVYIGEEFGSAPRAFRKKDLAKGSDALAVDIVLPGLENQHSLINGGGNCVLTAAYGQGLLSLPDMYAMKIIYGPRAKNAGISIENTVRKNIGLYSNASGKPVNQIKVIVLDRPRHKELIEDLKAAGLNEENIIMVKDDDLTSVIAVMLVIL